MALGLHFRQVRVREALEELDVASEQRRVEMSKIVSHVPGLSEQLGMYNSLIQIEPREGFRYFLAQRRCHIVQRV